MIYRVRSTDEPIVYYAGRSFEVASWRFSRELGNRVLERRLDDGWHDVMSYYSPTDERIRQLAASWATARFHRMRHAPVK